MNEGEIYLSKSKNRQDVAKQSIISRVRNFKEVTLGYTLDQALAEANRCLQCPSPTCIEKCPVGVNIPAFIKLIKEQRIDKALLKIREKNNLPAITGRVCPIEIQCEASCILNKTGHPISIGALERFVADSQSKSYFNEERSLPQPKGQKVAIVGSGPVGLTATADLAKLGYRVTVFESFHDIGGVLLYGIPEFRLPKHIIRTEVRYLKGLGVKFKVNTLIGNTLTIDELFNLGYKAIFIGAGAGTPNFLNIAGENLNGIYSANEFLTRINLMDAYKFPKYDTPIKIGKRVVVIGGGNVAIDSARSALRLGADSVTIVYRRSKEELPARLEEVENAEEEGIRFEFLSNPIRFIGDEKGRLIEVECIKMKLGEIDASGRRRAEPIPGSEFRIKADSVIVAIGRKTSPLISQNKEGLKTNAQGCLIVDKNLQTNKEGIWAGGDIVTGEATVISAMGMGKQVAKSIHAYLSKREKSTSTP